MAQDYPRMVRDCLIEVPAPLKGRPGYRWAQGWVVEYGPTRRSTPVSYTEARDMLRAARAQ